MEKRGVINEDTPAQESAPAAEKCCGGRCRTKVASDQFEAGPTTRAAIAAEEAISASKKSG